MSARHISHAIVFRVRPAHITSGISQLRSHFVPRLSPVTASRGTQSAKFTMASISIPTTMKGVLVEKTGGVEVLEYKTDLPVPVPKEGEVLVKNDFIGVNYIDT
jgi:hypothetical protein